MGDVVPFPEKKKNVAYKIPLYGDGEVKLALAVIHMFGEQVAGAKYIQSYNLKTYTPEFVIACIKLAIESPLFSAAGRKALNKILLAVEEVKVG